jgi:hypothetical protein
MKLKTCFSIIAAALLAVSCTKQGPTGPQGPAGSNGSANVSVEDYIVDPGQWSTNGNGGWYCDLAPQINPTEGAVSILFSYDDINWLGLPYVGNTLGDVDINYVVTNNNIQIQYVPQTNEGSVGAPGNPVYLQVSLVPPAIEVKHPDVNWQNAMQVAQLPEVQAAAKNH